jgi:hypothetical protein
MAYSTYTITLTDGNVLAYVTPVSVDTTSSALTLIGQADLGYGVPLNENLVHLLENFANTVPPYYVDNTTMPPTNVPIQPLYGQLWYDTTTGYLNLWDSSVSWEPVATQAWVDANFAGGSAGYATESFVEFYVSAQDFVTQTYLTDQGYLTANQTIVLSGDVSGSGSTSIVTALVPNGVTAGTYEKVIIDATGRVTIGEQLNQQDIINALGYTPASVGNGPGQTLYSYGALGTSVGTVLNYLGFESTNTNTNTLQLLETRFASGSDWTTASTRIQNITDVTSQGYIEFNPQSHPSGVGIGAANVVSLIAENTGGTNYVAINNFLNIVGKSASDPVLKFQTGTINNNNSGFTTTNTLGLISYSQTYGVIYFSANANGSNNVAILPDGSVNTIGLNGGTNGITLKTGTSNQLVYDINGNLLSKPSGSQVFSVDSGGNLTTSGTIDNQNGNWNSYISQNMNFWVNTSDGTNLGVLWFNYLDGPPYTWRMTAQPGGGGAANQFSYDANGICTVGTLYVNGNGGSQTGMENTTQTNLGFLNNGQRRIRIDGFYDFEANDGAGADEVIPGDINIFFGQGNYGDANPTNNGDRRRLCLQSDGNMVIYSLNDGMLWSADTAGSDERLKTNIKEYNDGLEFVKQLPVRTFEWKKTNKTFNDGGKTHVGFIAQELEEIEGHDAVAKHGKAEWRVVHKQAFVPHLVSAVQELATENDFLKDRVRKLEERLNMFEEILRQKL